jgi:hypothetical protein
MAVAHGRDTAVRKAPAAGRGRWIGRPWCVFAFAEDRTGVTAGAQGPESPRTPTATAVAPPRHGPASPW